MTADVPTLLKPRWPKRRYAEAVEWVPRLTETVQPFQSQVHVQRFIAVTPYSCHEKPTSILVDFLNVFSQTIF